MQNPSSQRLLYSEKYTNNIHKNNAKPIIHPKKKPIILLQHANYTFQHIKKKKKIVAA